MHQRDGQVTQPSWTSAQAVFHSPTGGCHTGHIIPPSRLCATGVGYVMVCVFFDSLVTQIAKESWLGWDSASVQTGIEAGHRER